MKIELILTKFPFLIIFFGLYNILFKILGIDYLYVFAYVLGIILSIIVLIKTNRKFQNYIVVLFSFFLFLNTLIVVLTHRYIDTSFVLQGILVYALPVIFWTLFLSIQNHFNFIKLINSLKYHVLLIALLGLLQYYFSPNLFGLLTNYSKGIEWASDSGDINDYRSYFRATSILTSPQIFGGFIGLYLISFVSVNPKSYLKKNINFLIILVLIISGIHSGNKSFFVIIGLSILYLLLIQRKILLTLILLVFFLIIFILFKDDYIFLDRIFSDNLLNEEKEGRLRIWFNTFENLYFFGEGAGSRMNSEFHSVENVTESYIIQILVELGVIPFILLLYLFIKNIMMSKGTKFRLTVLMTFFLMLVVHVFNSPAYILFWGLLLYPEYRKNNKL